MKISIISPILNCRKNLHDLIISILELNKKIELEWIVVDGGSTDGSREMVEGVSAELDITILRNNDGFYSSLNDGIIRSTGVYYICAGADDTFYPDSIEKVIGSIKEIEMPNFIAGGFVLRESRKKRYPGRYTYRLNGIAGLLSNHSIGLIIKKDLHNTFGLYDISYKYLADQKFCLNAALKSKKILRSNLLFGEVGEKGFSTNKNGDLKKEWERVKSEIF